MLCRNRRPVRYLDKELIAYWEFRSFTSSLIPKSRQILGFNVLIFLTAMFFLGVEPALYSILTYLAAARTLDFVLYGLEEFTAITIITTEAAVIRRAIIAGLGRGATIWHGYGGKTEREREILYCVVIRLEIGRIKEIARALSIKSAPTGEIHRRYRLCSLNRSV